MALSLAEVKRAMLAKALSSGLSPIDVAKLKLVPHTEQSLAKIEGLPQYLAAFAIPYFNSKGVTTKFFRVRYVEQPTGFAAMIGKPLRYAQPMGSRNEVYLPPFIDWSKMLKADNTIFITEGELKAACATRRGLMTVGLGGVSMFSNRKSGEFILPQLREFRWEDREAVVVFDSDAATNPNVLRAEAMLCRELLHLGARPYVVRLPNLMEHKTGLDDFLTHADGGVDALKELVDNAIPYDVSRQLHQFNEEVFFVAGSDIVFNPDRDLRMRPSSFVKSVYANRRMLVSTGKNMVERSAAQEWLNWEQRSEVENFTYRPGESQLTDKREYNLWVPWPYTPKKGDVSLWHRLLDHLFTDTDPSARKWFEQWIAYPMQHPGTKLKTAVVLWGGQGTGKSFVAEIVMRLYGAHNATKFGNAQLNAPFNEWAEHKQFAVGEEIVIHSGEKRSLAEMLKTLITDTTININRKFVNTYTLPNCMNMILLSNHANTLKLEEDDRRYFVQHVKSPKMDETLYRPLDKLYGHWAEKHKVTEGLAALFHYFLTLDLKGFDPQAAALHTADRYNMISGGRSEHGAWVAELKEDPDNVLKLGKAPVKYALFSLDDLIVLFKAKYERSQVTATTLGNELAMQGFMRAYPGTIRTSMGSKRLWVIRHDDRFRKFTPAQFGEWYDIERGRTPVHAKMTKKGK